MDIVPVCIAS